jgi:hypothetical protein
VATPRTAPASTPAAATGTSPAEAVAEPEKPVADSLVFVPYDKEEGPRLDSQHSVLLPYATFLRLKEEDDDDDDPDFKPSASLAQSTYRGEVSGDVARFEAELVIETIAREDDRFELDLPFEGAAVESASAEGEGAWLGPRREGPGLVATLKGEGRRVIKIAFAVSIQSNEDLKRVSFGVPRAAAASVELRVPGEVALETGPSALAKGSAAPQPLPARLEVKEDHSIIRAAAGSRQDVLLVYRVKRKIAEEVAAQARKETLFSVDQDIKVQVSGASARINVELTARALSGAASVLRFRLPETVQLLRVRGPLVAEWTRPGADGVATVALTREVDDSLELHLELDMKRSSPEERLVIPEIVVLDAVRQTGSIRVQPDAELTLWPEQTAGLESASSTEQVAPASGQLNARLLQSNQSNQLPVSDASAGERIYRFAQPGWSLAFSVKPIAPRVRADSLLLYETTEDLVRLKTRHEISISERGIFDIAFALPERYELREAGPSHLVAGWRQRDGRAEINFRSEQTAAAILTLRLERKRASLTEPVALEPVAVVGAEEDSGRVILATPLALRAVERSSTGLQAVDARSLRPRASELLSEDIEPTLAYRYFSPNFGAVVDIERQRARVTCETTLLASIDPARIKVDATLNYLVEFSAVDEFQFLAPEAVGEAIRFSDPDIKEKKRAQPSPGDELTTWTIRLQRKTLGNYPLGVSFELPLEKKAETGTASAPLEVILPKVRAVGVAREVGHIGVSRGENLEVGVARADDLEARDVKELPAGLSSAFLGFRYFNPDYRLILSLARHELDSVLGAVIRRMHVETSLSDQRVAWHEVFFEIQNNREQYLEFKLPKGSEIMSAYVAGAYVRPTSKEDGVKLVELIKSKTQSDAFRVRLMLREEALGGRGGDMGWLGNIRFSPPHEISIPVLRFTWKLYLPRDYDYVDFDGSMRLETGRNDPPMRWIFQQTLNDVPAGIAGGVAPMALNPPVHVDKRDYSYQETPREQSAPKGGEAIEIPLQREGKEFFFSKLSGVGDIRVEYWDDKLFLGIQIGLAVLTLLFLVGVGFGLGWRQVVYLIAFGLFLAASLLDGLAGRLILPIFGGSIIAAALCLLGFLGQMARSRTVPPSVPPSAPPMPPSSGPTAPPRSPITRVAPESAPLGAPAVGAASAFAAASTPTSAWRQVEAPHIQSDAAGEDTGEIKKLADEKAKEKEASEAAEEEEEAESADAAEASTESSVETEDKAESAAETPAAASMEEESRALKTPGEGLAALAETRLGGELAEESIEKEALEASEEASASAGAAETAPKDESAPALGESDEAQDSEPNDRDGEDDEDDDESGDDEEDDDDNKPSGGGSAAPSESDRKERAEGDNHPTLAAAATKPEREESAPSAADNEETETTRPEELSSGQELLETEEEARPEPASSLGQEATEAEEEEEEETRPEPSSSPAQEEAPEPESAPARELPEEKTPEAREALSALEERVAELGRDLQEFETAGLEEEAESLKTELAEAREGLARLRSSTEMESPLAAQALENASATAPAPAAVEETLEQASARARESVAAIRRETMAAIAEAIRPELESMLQIERGKLRRAKASAAVRKTIKKLEARVADLEQAVVELSTFPAQAQKLLEVFPGLFATDEAWTRISEAFARVESPQDLALLRGAAAHVAQMGRDSLQNGWTAQTLSASSDPARLRELLALSADEASSTESGKEAQEEAAESRAAKQGALVSSIDERPAGMEPRLGVSPEGLLAMESLAQDIGDREAFQGRTSEPYFEQEPQPSAEASAAAPALSSVEEAAEETAEEPVAPEPTVQVVDQEPWDSAENGEATLLSADAQRAAEPIASEPWDSVSAPVETVVAAEPKVHSVADEPWESSSSHELKADAAEPSDALVAETPGVAESEEPAALLSEPAPPLEESLAAAEPPLPEPEVQSVADEPWESSPALEIESAATDRDSSLAPLVASGPASDLEESAAEEVPGEPLAASGLDDAWKAFQESAAEPAVAAEEPLSQPLPADLVGEAAAPELTGEPLPAALADDPWKALQENVVAAAGEEASFVAADDPWKTLQEKADDPWKALQANVSGVAEEPAASAEAPLEAHPQGLSPETPPRGEASFDEAFLGQFPPAEALGTPTLDPESAAAPGDFPLGPETPEAESRHGLAAPEPGKSAITTDDPWSVADVAGSEASASKTPSQGFTMGKATAGFFYGSSQSEAQPSAPEVSAQEPAAGLDKPAAGSYGAFPEAQEAEPLAADLNKPTAGFRYGSGLSIFPETQTPAPDSESLEPGVSMGRVPPSAFPLSSGISPFPETQTPEPDEEAPLSSFTGGKATAGFFHGAATPAPSAKDFAAQESEPGADPWAELELAAGTGEFLRTATRPEADAILPLETGPQSAVKPPSEASRSSKATVDFSKLPPTKAPQPAATEPDPWAAMELPQAELEAEPPAPLPVEPSLEEAAPSPVPDPKATVDFSKMSPKAMPGPAPAASPWDELEKASGTGEFPAQSMEEASAPPPPEPGTPGRSTVFFSMSPAAADQALPKPVSPANKTNGAL